MDGESDERAAPTRRTNLFSSSGRASNPVLKVTGGAAGPRFLTF